MRNPLVVGVDGSGYSLRALDWAVSEAALHNVPLRLIYASMWDRYAKVLPGFGTGRPARRVLAEHIVASATERVERLAPDVRVSAALLAEDPVPGLLAEGRGAFALVLGYRGRGGIADLLLGSTSLSVAGQAQRPVVAVRAFPRRLRPADASNVTATPTTARAGNRSSGGGRPSRQRRAAAP